VRLISHRHDSITHFYYCSSEKLTRLNLSRNQFSAIPIETGNLELLKDLGQWDVGIGLLLQLIHLDVSHNQLAVWPPQIDLLVNLRHLDLSHNRIALVPGLLGSFVALEHLDLTYNVINTVPYELYELPRLKVSISITE
jgi:Leucine-rich repeat (LRR) protein